MTVTRDVIHDLLPAYFAGEVSTDTRKLVDEFLVTDPDFARMAERFRVLLADRQLHGVADDGGDAAREKMVFDRARSRAKLRQAALIWSLGAAFAFGMALLTGHGLSLFENPGTTIGMAFTATAIATWLLAAAPRPERWYALFVGKDQSDE